jgi:hypothetical protein
MSLRRTVVYVSVLLAAGAFAAEEPAPISEEASQRILDKLPDYDHEAAEAARKAAEPPGPDDELVVLPEMTVMERQQQKMNEEDLYKRGLLDEQLVERELSNFDREFLNRYHLPFIGMSKEARAREIYLERKNREFRESVNRVAGTLAQTDPKEAKRLRAALNGWK